MAFKSDRQRKAFFAKQRAGSRSNIHPTIVKNNSKKLTPAEKLESPEVRALFKTTKKGQKLIKKLEKEDLQRKSSKMSG